MFARQNLPNEGFRNNVSGPNVTISPTVGISNSNAISISNAPTDNLRAKISETVQSITSSLNDNDFIGESLQQITTNVLPPYMPPSPPNVRNLQRFFSRTHCCSDCGDTFALKSSLKFHLERRSVLIKLPCEACKCNRIFYNRCTLLSHVRQHADKSEVSLLNNVVLRPLPRVFMDGLQTEFVNTLDDEATENGNVVPATELLEFSLDEVGDDATASSGSPPAPSSENKCRCMECNEEFNSPEARIEHLTNNDKVPRVKPECTKCGMVCPSKCSLKAHQRIHLQVSPYICPECGDSPDAYWAKFQHHVKFKCFHHARGVGYKCPVCKAVCASIVSLQTHMELHTEKYLKCSLCPSAYLNLQTFSKHFDKTHEGMPKKYTTIYKCSLCDVVFLSAPEMLAHRLTHLKQQVCEYVFNCMQCGKALESKALLLEHIKAYHPKIHKFIYQEENSNEVRPSHSAIAYTGKVECLLCNYSFTTFQRHNVHMAKAHVNINQTCSYCFMVIGNRREMVIHGKKHLKKGNIVCLLCNNMKFPDEKSLDLHLLKHVEKLQFCSFCPICSEILPNYSQSRGHLQVEHYIETEGEQSSTATSNSKSEVKVNIICFVCEKTFGSTKELQDHTKFKHGTASNTTQETNDAINERDELPSKKQCVELEGNACAKCDYHSANRDEFKAHLLTHKTTKASYQCLECGLCFVIEPTLSKHLRIIHKIKDPVKYIREEGTNFAPDDNKTADTFSCDALICNVCYTNFPTEASLKTHMRSHGMAFIQAKKSNTVL